MDKTCLTVVLMDPAAKTLAAPLRAKQGNRIREYREFHKLSQSALAEAVGVSKAAVSEWERGMSTPRQTHQIRIANTLRAPWTAIFGLDGEVA